jgi:hypothetical protein
MTYSDVRLAHASLTIDVVLAHDPVAIMDAFAAFEAANTGNVCTERVGRAIGVQDVHTAACIFLRMAIG